MNVHINQVMGVDYGAKLAGTTAVAMLVHGRLQVWQSKLGQDADTWLMNLIRELAPELLLLDAPLSLPAIYTSTTALPNADYFYRSCDRALQAMSPMFLGGLTARAMKLKAQLAEQPITILETYPSQLRKLLLPDFQNYKKGTVPPPAFAEALQQLTGYTLAETLQSWHMADAVLAWHSGNRYLHGQAIIYGDAAEGQIII